MELLDHVVVLLLVFFVFVCFLGGGFGLHCVFIAAHGLSLIAASWGYFSLWCTGFSLWWLLVAEHGLLGTQASVVVAQ